VEVKNRGKGLQKKRGRGCSDSVPLSEKITIPPVSERVKEMGQKGGRGNTRGGSQRGTSPTGRIHKLGVTLQQKHGTICKTVGGTRKTSHTSPKQFQLLGGNWFWPGEGETGACQDTGELGAKKHRKHAITGKLIFSERNMKAGPKELAHDQRRVEREKRVVFTDG